MTWPFGIRLLWTLSTRLVRCRWTNIVSVRTRLCLNCVLSMFVVTSVLVWLKSPCCVTWRSSVSICSLRMTGKTLFPPMLMLCLFLSTLLNSARGARKLIVGRVKVWSVTVLLVTLNTVLWTGLNKVLLLVIGCLLNRTVRPTTVVGLGACAYLCIRWT